MADYVEVARLEQLPCGAGTVVTVGNGTVALFNVDGTVLALIADACLHQDAHVACRSQTPSRPQGGQSLSSYGWRYDVARSPGSTLHVPDTASRRIQ